MLYLKQGDAYVAVTETPYELIQLVQLEPEAPQD
jgi:hypothetical protein